LLIILGMGLEIAGIKWRGVTEPMREDVRRETFKGTRSFNEAKTQDLARYRLQYLTANDKDKEVLASTIRIMFADYDSTLLPIELASFLTQIRGY